MRNRNHHCGSDIGRYTCDLSSRIRQFLGVLLPHQQSKTFHQVYHGSRNGQCLPISGHVGHQETIYTGHKVYRIPQNVDRYSHFQKNNPPHVKREVAQSLYHKATIICQEQTDRSDETDILRHVLQPASVPIHRVS
jgi:hypothetical protein